MRLEMLCSFQIRVIISLCETFGLNLIVRSQQVTLSRLSLNTPSGTLSEYPVFYVFETHWGVRDAQKMAGDRRRRQDSVLVHKVGTRVDQGA